MAKGACGVCALRALAKSVSKVRGLKVARVVTLSSFFEGVSGCPSPAIFCA